MSEPSERTKVTRRLAAILAADIAGYSALMGADEARTVRDLKEHQAVVLPMIKEHGGRVIDTAGDGILAEFSSVVSAAECAVAIQRTMEERNAGVEEARRMRFRIGINQGDVVFDEARVYGDGVNVAARLENLAEPGGICISRRVYEDINGKIKLAFVDLGEQQLKNIAQPVRVYRASVERLPVAQVTKKPTLVLPEKPSIAVLPFENMSGNPEQEYFVDGLVEDITTSLCCIPSLFVIARNSAFTYKGRAVDVSQIGRELGIRYVLEGSVRQAGGRLRITVQLISAETRRHLWAKRFDGAATDVFDLQDRVAEEVVGAIAPRFEAAEVDRARRKRPGSLDAWDLVLRALPLIYSMTREGQEEALGLLARATALDPDYALPLGLAAWCRALRVPQRGGDPAEEAREGLALARRALVAGPDDAEALVMAGYALGFLGRDPAAGLAPIDRAHALNPNSARGFTFSGWLRSYRGEHEVATDHFTRALRLSPLDLQAFRTRAGLAFAHLFAGRLEAAVEAARLALEEQPNFSPAHRALAVALAHLGRTEEARKVIRRALAVVPGLTTAYAVAETRFLRAEDRALLEEGLRRAGLPE